MSHLGTRFLNMMSSAEVLRGTLSLYNWREDELNNRRLDAILAVSHHRIQRFEQGFLLRGLDIEVTLDGSGFAVRAMSTCLAICSTAFSHCMPI